MDVCESWDRMSCTAWLLPEASERQKLRSALMEALAPTEQAQCCLAVARLMSMLTWMDAAFVAEMPHTQMAKEVFEAI